MQRYKILIHMESKKSKWCTNINNWRRIYHSFNLAKHIPRCRVVGTTYLSKTEFKSVYSDAENMLNSRSMLSNLRIIHSVDATQLGKKNHR